MKQNNKQNQPIKQSLEDDDFAVQDVEQYKFGSGQEFNHQVLVMKSLLKCIEAGSQEMRPGWYNDKTDNQGNTITTYIEDTRKKFVETVKSAKMIMICDFDEEAETNIKELEETLSNKYNELLTQQTKNWNILPKNSQENYTKKGMGVIPGIFNPALPFYQRYCEMELEVYRKICEELSLLSKRLGFYQMEDFEA